MAREILRNSLSKVTQIKPQKNQKRFNVYLDGKFALALPAEALAKAGLIVDQELSEKQLKDLIFKSEFQKLLDKTLRLVSLRPRSEKEIRDYLKKKISNFQPACRTGRFPISNYSKSNSAVRGRLLDKVVASLRRQNLINDQAFAVWWLEQRETFRPRGKFGLKAELAQKGISREIIEKVLGELDELFLAKRAADRKLKAYQKLSSREFRQKLSAFLSRQGFSWETIRMTIDQLEKKGYN